MCYRFLLPLVLSCALLFAPVGKPAVAEERGDVSALLARLQHHFPSAEREQQQVMRSLRLVVGNEVVPTLDGLKAREWVQSKSSLTGEESLKRIRDELGLARKFTLSEDLATRRGGLALALDACRVARERGDMPLTTAIGVGFLLPYLLDAPESGSESRFQILRTLEEPFSLFELLPLENQRLPLPDNDAALAFHRLQIALAPTPREADWPRARLARRLLRGNGTSADRATAYSDAQASEAFDALRGLVPGEGTLFFRNSMPTLTKRIRGIKGILSPAESLDSAQTARNHSGYQYPLAKEALVTLDVLRALCHNSPADKAVLIEETARRCNFAPGERARLEADADKDFEAQIQKFKRYLGPNYSEIPRSRAALYRGYYITLRALDVALRTGNAKTIRQKWDALNQVSYWPDDDSLLTDTLRWQVGDYHYNAEFNAYAEQITETFRVDLVPFADTNITYSNNIEELTRGFSHSFLSVYPNWPSIRERRVKAEERALNDVEQGKTAILVPYDPSQNARMCALSRAACDLLVRTASSENHYDGALHSMLETLAAEDRLEDALLVVDLQWAREHFALNEQNLNSYWTKDLNQRLQARFATPTLLRPLP